MPSQSSLPAVGASARQASPTTMAVLGIPLALTSSDETMDWMDDRVMARDRVFLCAAAVHLVMVAREDPAVREAVMRHDLVLPDGVPLVWAQRGGGGGAGGRGAPPPPQAHPPPGEGAPRGGREHKARGSHVKVLLPRSHRPQRVVHSCPGQAIAGWSR